LETDPLLVSAFWPPTTLTGLVIWISIVVLGIAYAYRKKSRFKEGARLQIHWVDFGTRTFATAVSTSLLLLQASGVQLFSPLGGAGTGQLYIAFGLIVSLAILVSNLRQKLDSFVVPKTLEEEPETVEEVPPPPPIFKEVQKTETPQDKREIENRLREVYSPVHALIMRVKQYTPSETARQLGIGNFVPASIVPALADVSRAFQHHDLENRHLNKWLELEAEIKRRGGFYLTRDRQAWFDELEADYQQQVSELKKPK